MPIPLGKEAVQAGMKTLQRAFAFIGWRNCGLTVWANRRAGRSRQGRFSAGEYW